MPTVERAWTLKRSTRTRRLWLSVRRDGTVLVTAPPYAPLAAIEHFVRDRAEWIARTVAVMRRRKDDVYLPRGRRSYLACKERARLLVHGFLAAHAPFYGLRYGKVFIKDMRRNWGSCSELGNLNFNYKLIFLPPKLAEYVVVHELCHLERFDHSSSFWDLVKRAVPDAKATRKELRKYHA